MVNFAQVIDYAPAFEVATQPMAVVEVTGSALQIREVNHTFQDACEWSAERLTGTSLSSVVNVDFDLGDGDRVDDGGVTTVTADPEATSEATQVRMRPVETDGSKRHAVVAVTNLRTTPPEHPDAADTHAAGEFDIASDPDSVGTARLCGLLDGSADSREVCAAATALLVNGFGFDAATVDLDNGSVHRRNKDTSLPRLDGDETSLCVRRAVADGATGGTWQEVVQLPIEGVGVVRAASREEPTLTPPVETGLRLLARRLADALDGVAEAQTHDSDAARPAVLNRILRHEAANDLSVIDSRLARIGDHVSATAQADLNTAADRVDDLLELVEAVRTVADTRRVDIEPRPLAPFVEQAVEAVDDLFPEGDIAVVDAIPPADVRVDRLFAFCLRNLLRNSFQHAAIEAPTVRVTVERVDETVEVRVADNGGGISEDLDRSVFDRGVSSTEEAARGDGLYLTARLVEDTYGGRVRSGESAIGGAEFVVSLPVAHGGDP